MHSLHLKRCSGTDHAVQDPEWLERLPGLIRVLCVCAALFPLLGLLASELAPGDIIAHWIVAASALGMAVSAMAAGALLLVMRMS